MALADQARDCHTHLYTESEVGLNDQSSDSPFYANLLHYHRFKVLKSGNPAMSLSLIRLAALFLCLGGFASSTSADDAIQLPKLARLGVESPLKIQVKGIAAGSYMGTIADSGKQMIVQVGLGAAGADQAVMIVPADLELTGQTLSLKPIALKTQGVTIEDNGDSMQVNVGGKPFFSALAQSGNKPVIYPIYGPSGVEMTRNYPMKDVAGEQRDHPHQRSMWMTFGKVNNLDFWASDPINGDKKHFGKIKVVSAEASQGPLAGSIRSDKEWLDHEGKLVLNERCTIVVYNLGDQRIMDADFVLTAPDNAPVVFGDTKEGMFGLRVPSLLDTKAKKGGKIVNAEGIADDAAWGKSSSWVDYSGLIDGKTVGVAILNHPDSFRYPTHWHVRNYGLFAANPFGYKDFGLGKTGEYKLEAGKSVHFGYRVVFHNGRHDEAKIADAFKAYAAGKP